MKNILEIIIPSYNRKEHIERTLKQITAANSPVKDCQITVVDNASTDGASEFIQDFAKQHPNIKHIRNSRNIGMCANIARCYELATFPYVWVFGNDDSFKWDTWPEIENALRTNEYDALIIHKNNLKYSSDIAKIYRQCASITAAIYRTSVMTDGVVVNMYNNAYTLFPHLAIISEIFNRKGRIFVSSGEIMAETNLDKYSGGDGTHYRCYKTFIPDTARNIFWGVGVLMSTQMIEDKKLRNYVLDHIGSHGFFGFIFASYRLNYKLFDGYKYNEAIVHNTLDFWHRLQFDFACMLLKIMYFFKPKKRVNKKS